MEAQVSGCPVVCFDVGGIKECVQNGKSGVVINAVSIDGLTSNLDLLLSNKEKLKEFSDYAAKTFYKIYNWDNSAKEFISYTTKDLNLDICVFKPFLARGLEIYTGCVWEVFDRTGEFKSALGGGGRYDNIITKFL